MGGQQIGVTRKRRGGGCWSAGGEGNVSGGSLGDNAFRRDETCCEVSRHMWLKKEV